MPRLVRALLVALLALGTLAVRPVGAEARAARGLTVEEAVARVEQRLHVLHDDARGRGFERWSDLVTVARRWSTRLADEDRLAHNPDFADQICCWRTVGENVGRHVLVVDRMTRERLDAVVDELMRLWLDSAGHARNVHHPDFDHLGIGAGVRATPTGDGRTRWDIVVTANFRHWDGTPVPNGRHEIHGAPARDIATSCADAPSAGFRDTTGTALEDLVDCAVHHGLTRGTSDDTFAPGDALTRAQAATFVRRLLTASGHAVPDATRDHFTDDDGTVHEAATNALAEAGIVEPTDSARFRPGDEITRVELSTMTARALARAGALPSRASAHWFLDLGQIDDGRADLTQRLADVGVVTGVATRAHAPERSVTRAQMAAYLVRALDAAERG